MQVQFDAMENFRIQAEKRQLKSECNLMGLVTAGSNVVVSGIIAVVLVIFLILKKSDNMNALLSSLEMQIIFSVLI